MTINFNGQTIDIGKVDERAVKLWDEAERAQGRIERARAQWAFLGAIIDGEQMHEAVQGATVGECDLPTLGALYEAVTSEIDRPRREAQARAINEQIGAVDVAKLAKMMDALSMLGGAAKR